MKSTSYERFLVLLARIEKDGETGLPVEKKIQSYLKNDTRGSVFRVEGMLRLFAEHAQFGDDFKKGYKKSRDFEDFLGHYADSLKFQKKVADLGLGELQGVVSARVATDRDVLNQFIENEWPDGQEDRWREKYRERFSQIKGTEENNFLITEITKFITDVRTREYNFDLLQKGVHEYRRKLRWILLMMQASGGFFELVDDPELEQRYSKYLEGSGVRESSFSKIPELYRQKKTCPISRPLFEMLTLAVFRIGAAKDSGELIENLAKAYEATGDSPAEAHRKALKIGQAEKDYQEPKPVALQWQKILNHERILEQISEQITACLTPVKK